MIRLKRFLPWMLLLGLASAALLIGPGLFKARDARKGLELDSSVAMVETRNLDSRVEVTGDVLPDNQLDVRPEVGGKIVRLHVKPGDLVDQGTLLVEIDDEPIQNEKASVVTEIEGAQLTVEKNRKNYQRARDLFDSKLVSREVFDNISSDYELARNALARAERRLALVEERLGRTRIHAPMRGTILDVRVIEGQVVVGAASVNSGTQLMTLADLSHLSVSTHVNQIDITRLQMGQTVEITSESLGNARMNAEVTFIAPLATVKNGVKGFRVDAAIREPDARLRPGMSVRMEIPIAHVNAAVTVPISAVFRGEDGTRVVYVQEGDQTEKRVVDLGLVNYEYAEVKSGVRPGERILLTEPRPGASPRKG